MTSLSPQMSSFKFIIENLISNVHDQSGHGTLQIVTQAGNLGLRQWKVFAIIKTVCVKDLIQRKGAKKSAWHCKDMNNTRLFIIPWSEGFPGSRIPQAWTAHQDILSETSGPLNRSYATGIRSTCRIFSVILLWSSIDWGLLGAVSTTITAGAAGAPIKRILGFAGWTIITTHRANDRIFEVVKEELCIKSAVVIRLRVCRLRVRML